MAMVVSGESLAKIRAATGKAMRQKVQELTAEAEQFPLA
jgi:hypothetical protein